MRPVFCALGLLELAIAAVLIWVGAAAHHVSVAEGFGKAEAVARQAGAQVRLVRQHVNTLRQAELNEWALTLQEQARTVTAMLRAQQVDFDTIQTLRDGLNELAKGLGEFASAVPPDCRSTLTRAAMLLGRTRDQLQLVVQNKPQYEKAWEQAVRAGESFALSLPALTEQLNGELADQDQALDELARSISDVADLLPGYGQTVEEFLVAGRLLAWLLAAGLGLHGVYLLVAARRWSRICNREKRHLVDQMSGDELSGILATDGCQRLKGT
jgi:hypothetical protein